MLTGMYGAQICMCLKIHLYYTVKLVVRTRVHRWQRRHEKSHLVLHGKSWEPTVEGDGLILGRRGLLGEGLLAQLPSPRDRACEGSSTTLEHIRWLNAAAPQ